MNVAENTKILSQEELNKIFSKESLDKYKDLIPYENGSGIIEYRESLYFIKD